MGIILKYKQVKTIIQIVSYSTYIFKQSFPVIPFSRSKSYPLLELFANFLSVFVTKICIKNCNEWCFLPLPEHDLVT